MPVAERETIIAASAECVFGYVDDIRNLARHMSERGSMPMMGSKLKLEILTAEPTGVGATYLYSGRMLGLAIDFPETVNRYVPGRENVWRTIGEPRLLIIESYEMGVRVEPIAEGQTRLTIAVDYTLPRSGLWHVLGRLLAATYARWCLDSMIDGIVHDFTRSAS